MSNSASKEMKARLFDLNSKVLELVREGKRDPRWVADVLQGIMQDDLQALRRDEIMIGNIGLCDFLEVVEERISIISPAFSRSSLFSVNSPLKMVIKEGFSSLILKKAPEDIGSFTGELSKLRLSYQSYVMSDLGIVREIQWSLNPSPPIFFNVPRLLSTLKVLMESQRPNEEGTLINEYVNLFYVEEYEERFSVSVWSDVTPSGNACWFLDADGFGESAKGGENALFVYR